jgi:hypothetical protein
MPIQTLVGETLGIEFETDSLFREGRYRNEAERSVANFWSTTRDASIETDCQTLGGIIVNKLPDKLKKYFRTSKNTSGVEFVSHIMDYNEIEKIELALNSLVELLRICGEPLTSERSGIHFHITMPYNLRILKSIVRLGANLEDFYFYLGGFGYEHRGNKNDHIYCRPITEYGPTVVQYDGKNGHQVFNIKDLLESKTANEFWYRYYATSVERQQDHYCPVRYHWLNLLSLVQKGSLEFRVFNKTLNVDYIMAALETCIKFSELAIASSFDTLKAEDFITKNSIYLKRDKETILSSFSSFAERTRMSDKSYTIVREIINKTPEIKIEPEYCLSHKNDAISPYRGQSGYSPRLVPLEVVKKPKFVDIHVLRGEREGGVLPVINFNHAVPPRRNQNIPSGIITTPMYGVLTRVDNRDTLISGFRLPPDYFLYTSRDETYYVRVPDGVLVEEHQFIRDNHLGIVPE